MGPGVLEEAAWFDRVRLTIRRYGMLAPGDRAGVAVSGGADSVALLHALWLLRAELGVELEVLHLDHGLRGEESDTDARFVEELAGRLGLPFHLRRAELKTVEENLEQVARRARLAFFAEVKAARGLARVATGHTRSDQAETVLFRLLRGAGPGGLAAILPVTREGLIRPLLEVTRAEAREWLRAGGQVWREDSSNCSRELARNRIRLELMPALARDWNPELEAALARTALLAAEDETAWTGQVERVLPLLAVERAGGLVIEAARVRALPPALARRALRALAERVAGSLAGWEFQHVETLLALSAQPEGDGRAILPGVDAWRSFEWLRLARPGAAPARNWAFDAQAGGSFSLPDGSVVELQTIDAQEVGGGGDGSADSYYNKGSCVLDFNGLGLPLRLRAWRPGDAYHPEGLAGEEKLKTLFQRARIPLWERRDWPIITAGDEVIWARRFGAAARHRARSAARKMLRIVDRTDSSRVE